MEMISYSKKIGKTKTHKRKLYDIAIAIDIPKIFKGGKKENDNKENDAIVVKAEPNKAMLVEDIHLIISFSLMKLYVI